MEKHGAWSGGVGILAVTVGDLVLLGSFVGALCGWDWRKVAGLVGIGVALMALGMDGLVEDSPRWP